MKEILQRSDQRKDCLFQIEQIKSLLLTGLIFLDREFLTYLFHHYHLKGPIGLENNSQIQIMFRKTVY